MLEDTTIKKDISSFVLKVGVNLLLTCFLMTAVSSFAETAEEKGLRISLESDRRDSGFTNSSATLQMTLYSQNGDTVQRQMRQKTLEVADDGDRTIMVFDRPKDLKGTAVLTYSHKKGDDDQWLYLPALKRVKRISSSDRSGPFMGSEFAFEDITPQELEKFAYKFLKDDTLEGDSCFVVERTPLDKNSGYTRQVVWVDKAEYRPRKIEYYDRKGELLKTLTMKDFKKYLSKFWRPSTMTMKNHQTGKSTVLSYSDYIFKTGIGPEDFSREALSTVR